MSSPRIHVLSDHVANQIAAGEVVERPESVVKELVENALDAGATRVRVEVEDGGQRLIRVLDDGHGMSADDALTALLRHATSKVRTVDDLKAIATLGFRGEALPSIRSVSRFSLRTRALGAPEGVRIFAHGAEEPRSEPAGGPVGTDIAVEDLFFNVPARRKFLKQSATELHRIRGFIERIALGWPEVHFTLQNQGKTVLDLPADGDLQARILAVLGREVCRRLHRVELEVGHHRVHGYAGEPSFTKSGPAWLYTYINGRFIRDKVVQHAVAAAYGPELERGHYPVAVLFLFVPPDAVDINVHPSKSEVRFVETGAIHGLVTRSLRLLLNDAPWGQLSRTPGGPMGGENTALGFLPLLMGEPEPRGAWTAVPVPVPDPGPGFTPVPNPAALPLLDPVSSRPTAPRPHRAPPLALSRRIGLVQGRFLLLEEESGLLAVDLHVAAAQLALARIGTGVASTGESDRGHPSEVLLFPQPVTLSARDRELAGDPLLRFIGFAVEPFGGAEVLLSAIPSGLPPGEPARLLRAGLTALSLGQRNPVLVAETVLNACDLTRVAVDDAALGRLLSDLDDPVLGPIVRGRAVATLSTEAMERWFSR